MIFGENLLIGNYLTATWIILEEVVNIKPFSTTVELPISLYFH